MEVSFGYSGVGRVKCKSRASDTQPVSFNERITIGRRYTRGREEMKTRNHAKAGGYGVV